MHGKILFLHFIVTVNSVHRPSFGAPSNVHRSLVSFTSHQFPSYRRVYATFCAVNRVAYESHPTAVHDASPPNVVGPSSSASSDALNATVDPSGTVATPARIVNVSAHDAPGEQTIRHAQLAWHRVASPSVGAPPAHAYVGGAHDDAVNARASARASTHASAVAKTVARDAMFETIRRAMASTRALLASTSRPSPLPTTTTDGRRARVARLPRPTARVASTSASASRDDDETGDETTTTTFYAYDEDAWRAFERAFGTTPREPWFGPLQLAIAVVLAGIVDAGWSGDWSRIGALTEAQEANARAFIEFVCVAHAAAALAARDVALKRGRDGTWAFIKTFVVGFMGFVDASFGGADETE